MFRPLRLLSLSEFGRQFVSANLHLGFLYSGFIEKICSFLFIFPGWLIGHCIQSFLEGDLRGLTPNDPRVYSHLENGSQTLFLRFFHVHLSCVSFCEMSTGPWHFDSVPVRSGLFGSCRKDLFQQVICVPERVLRSERLDWIMSGTQTFCPAGAGGLCALSSLGAGPGPGSVSFPPVEAYWLLRPLPWPLA